jgi:hypothetical protein
MQRKPMPRDQCRLHDEQQKPRRHQGPMPLQQPRQ